MAESNNIPVSNSNSDLIDTSENATGEINTRNAVNPLLDLELALAAGHTSGSISLSGSMLREFANLNFSSDSEDNDYSRVVIVHEVFSDILSFDSDSTTDDEDYDVMPNNREFVDLSDFVDWIPEDLPTDPIKRIKRNDILPNPRSPPKEFIPRKLTENVVYILPVLFTKKNILPSDLFSLRFGIYSEYKKVIQYVLNGTNGIFTVSRKFDKNTTILGSTVEIYKITGNKESVEFPVYSMAHQMCEILSVEPFPEVLGTTLIGLAKIKILPANISCYPYQKLGTATRNRYSRGDNAVGDRSMQTPWSSWMYKQLEPDTLASRLVAKVKLLFTDISLTSKDPYLLSFEVLNLNIFTEEQRHYLQTMNSSLQRMQYEIQSMDNLICFYCSAVVTSIENVFNMPHVRDLAYGDRYYKMQNTGMITATKLNMEFKINSQLSSIYCLYTGYKWQTVLCGSCLKLLGWRYITEQNSLQTPKLFFGLRRSAVTSTKYYLTKQEQQNIKPLGAKESIGYWSLIRD